MRAREAGIRIGLLEPGPLDAITDVAGVRVGHETLIAGDGPLVVGSGPVRTGVTVILPRAEHAWDAPVFAGCHTLNGAGEMTGLEWLRECGTLNGPIAITNTHSVGVVRDALIQYEGEIRAARGETGHWWSLPVVAETYDGTLNDVNGMHVRPEHVRRALAAASGGPVAEGNVGGGTGMICYGFKGGIGTASRVASRAAGGFTVGALVQANFGRRERLRIDGVPVGEAIPTSEVPRPGQDSRPGVTAAAPPGAGSIIAVLATDAPLLPHQCTRLAQRAGLGVARTGGGDGNTSGDIFLAFSTGNAGVPPEHGADIPLTATVKLLANVHIAELLSAAIEATEAAIVNALLAAETMVGRDGIVAHRLNHARLREVLARYGRPARPPA
ncbi:MAG: P1 family peptidase [Chloroflexota bacterium]